MNDPEIEVKKKDKTNTDVKSIIFLLRAFYVYTQIISFLTVSGKKLQF